MTIFPLVPRFTIVSLLAIALQPATGLAQGPTPADARPWLVLAISVDQMRGDYIDRYGTQLTGGLGRIARQGALFLRAYQDHGLTETAPGHSTILSGRHPASTGIIRNSDGVDDSAAALIGTTGPGASPGRFVGTTLVDWLHARYPGSRTLSVSRKDRSAILMVGRAKVPVFWFAGGRFTTSRYYADSLPDWVQGMNREMAGWRPPADGWTLMREASRYPELDNAPWEHGGRDVVFPHRMAAPGQEGGLSLIETPWMDSVTLAFALRGVETLGLGRGPTPDVVALGLSSGDAVGHGWGPDSREIRDQVLRLDHWLGQFLDSLSRLRDPSRLLIVVTADHGISSYPEFLQSRGRSNVGYVVLDTVLRQWQAALEERAGPGRWLPSRGYGMVLMNAAGLAARGVDPDSVSELLARDLRRLPGVLRVDTRRSLMRGDTSRDPVLRRWRHALPDSMPGVGPLVTLKPGMVFGIPNGAARHGQNSDLDAHVTLLFWGPGIRSGRYRERVGTTDIAPTLAYLLGITPDADVQGRVLREALLDGR